MVSTRWKTSSPNGRGTIRLRPHDTIVPFDVVSCRPMELGMGSMIGDDNTKQASTALQTDVVLVLFLIGFDVGARLLLQVPNVSPVAASALFGGMMLRRRSLALIVPLAAMLIGDAFAGFYDWRGMTVVYAVR